MKAVIPVAGAGTRLRPHTYTQPKALIPVAGKPILCYIIDQLIENNIDEFVFIIGYLGEKIQDFVSDKYPDLNAVFVYQNQRNGLGHAIWCAKEVIEDSEILIVLGDTIVEGEIKEILDCEDSALGIKKVDDPREFGVAILNEKNSITNLIEKPKIPKSNLALVGVYKIKETNTLLNCLNENIKNDQRTNGEFHLTDGILRMIKNENVQIKGIHVGNWHDLGKRDILLETNAVLLKNTANQFNNGNTQNTIILPPVSIAKGAVIKNSIVGPNVTIGENSSISFSIIQDSIIGNFTNLDNVSLEHSIIGSDAIIKGHSQSLNIGDNTEIDLSGN